MEQRLRTSADLMGSLCCTLLDRRSSAPLAGARITCVWRDKRVTRHDADRFGRFTARMPQGAYDFVISARGYLSLLVRGVGILAGYDQRITRALIPGEGSDPDVEPATALGGYVTDRLGRGVGNVTVQIVGQTGSVTYSTRTERDGAYLVHSVIPQMYDLTVSAVDRRLAREYVPIAGSKEFIRLDIRLVQI